jgi:hypothetical protein
MFDLARLRPNLGERLGFLVVIFVLVASLLGPAVALLDSQRHQPAWSQHTDDSVAQMVEESIEISVAEPCPCPSLVLRVPARPSMVSPSESL